MIVKQISLSAYQLNTLTPSVHNISPFFHAIYFSLFSLFILFLFPPLISSFLFCQYKTTFRRRCVFSITFEKIQIS